MLFPFRHVLEKALNSKHKYSACQLPERENKSLTKKNHETGIDLLFCNPGSKH